MAVFIWIAELIQILCLFYVRQFVPEIAGDIFVLHAMAFGISHLLFIVIF